MATQIISGLMISYSFTVVKLVCTDTQVMDRACVIQLHYTALLSLEELWPWILQAYSTCDHQRTINVHTLKLWQPLFIAGWEFNDVLWEICSTKLIYMSTFKKIQCMIDLEEFS